MSSLTECVFSCQREERLLSCGVPLFLPSCKNLSVYQLTLIAVFGYNDYYLIPYMKITVVLVGGIAAQAVKLILKAAKKPAAILSHYYRRTP